MGATSAATIAASDEYRVTSATNSQTPRTVAPIPAFMTISIPAAVATPFPPDRIEVSQKSSQSNAGVGEFRHVVRQLQPGPADKLRKPEGKSALERISQQREHSGLLASGA
jgi:hypothetical protein